MHKIRLSILLCLGIVSSAAYSMDATFDRASEVDKYIEELKTESHGRLELIAREIYDSGISDHRLAAAINERLMQDYPHISFHGQDELYAVAMARALASMGLIEYSSSVTKVCRSAIGMHVKSDCIEDSKRIKWHAAKNVVMSSTENQHDGDDPRVSRLLNLLKSDNDSYRAWVLDRMNWDRILDARLMEVIASYVQRYVDRGGGTLSAVQDDTMAQYVKLLGYSKDVRYRPLLEKVNALKNISAGVRRHSKYAMDKLW